MDGQTFDLLTRGVVTALSRRRITGWFGGAILGGLLLPASGSLTQAKKKRKKKKCKKCSVCQTCNKKGKCKAKPNGSACGPGTCQNGSCVCPTECCSNLDCADGAVCLSNGSCAVTCDAQEDCPPNVCQCGLPSVDGPSRCVVYDLSLMCADMPECSSTVNCLEGWHCQKTNCDGNPNRCFPLCAV